MSETEGLKRTTPESQGLPSAAVGELLDYFARKRLEIHSLMLLRHGQVLAEGWWKPYGPERPHMLFSLSKSFTSTAIGFAVQEGLFTVDDEVCSFFPEELPQKVGPNLAKMRIRHLLTMSTGHEEDPSGRVHAAPDGNWVKAFLAEEVPREPGTHFVYNTAATYMLSAILHKVTGQRLLDYLTPRLFQPLGITGATWERCPRGIDTGGYGLSLRTEDIAKFGQFYLQEGMWNGQQLLSPAWIREATSKQIDNDNVAIEWRQGYGYQFWRCRHNAYRGDGAFGQFCVVVPEKDLVVAITAGTDDMQGVLDGIWEIILPALSPDPLPEANEEQERLLAKLENLALAPLPGEKRGTEESFAGRYVFPHSELGVKAISFTFRDDSIYAALELPQGQAEITCGYGRYGEGSFPPPSPSVQGSSPAFSCAARQSANTLEIMTRLVETPFSYHLTCTFTPGEVELSFRMNVGFGRREFPPVRGKLSGR